MFAQMSSEKYVVSQFEIYTPYYASVPFPVSSYAIKFFQMEPPKGRKRAVAGPVHAPPLRVNGQSARSPGRQAWVSNSMRRAPEGRHSFCGIQQDEKTYLNH
jgi:hypothetical protein